jgi:hypothetical protein
MSPNRLLLTKLTDATGATVAAVVDEVEVAAGGDAFALVVVVETRVI